LRRLSPVTSHSEQLGAGRLTPLEDLPDAELERPAAEEPAHSEPPRPAARSRQTSRRFSQELARFYPDATREIRSS
jgi:hypothetical protein